MANGFDSFEDMLAWCGRHPVARTTDALKSILELTWLTDRERMFLTEWQDAKMEAQNEIFENAIRTKWGTEGLGFIRPTIFNMLAALRPIESDPLVFRRQAENAKSLADFLREMPPQLSTRLRLTDIELILALDELFEQFNKLNRHFTRVDYRAPRGDRKGSRERSQFIRAVSESVFAASGRHFDEFVANLTEFAFRQTVTSEQVRNARRLAHRRVKLKVRRQAIE